MYVIDTTHPAIMPGEDYLIIRADPDGKTRLAWGTREQGTNFDADSANALASMCDAFFGSKRFKVVV